MRWLLRRLLNDEDRRAIEDELSELYEFRRRGDGPRAAGRWLWRQRALYSIYLVSDRLRSAAASLTGEGGLMSGLWLDVTHAARGLWRSPGLAMTIVLTVGLGLGMTTAMVTVIDAVVLKPLPYADQNALLWIYTDRAPNQWPLSVADYRAIDDQQTSFSHLASFETSPVTLTDGAAARRVLNRNVTWAYFSTLGLSAARGRLFDKADDVPDLKVAVLSRDLWTTTFGADPSVIGRVIPIDGVGHTVVGIVADNGPLGHDIGVYRPVHWSPPRRRGPFFLRAIARLKPGVTQAAALEEVHAINLRAFPPRPPAKEPASSFGLRDLKSRAVGNVASTLVFVLAAVGCVLLIACVNAVNLLLARAMRRSRELAIRAAIGASRRKLLRYLAVETALLTVASGSVGLVIAAGAVELIVANGAAYIPRIDEIRLAGPALLWLGVLSVGSFMVIGLVPAIQGARLGEYCRWQFGGRTTTDNPAARRVRRLLVAAEFAIATPLLVAAMLVLISLDRLRDVPIGVEGSTVLTASVSLPQGLYPDNASRRSFWNRALERLRAIPGAKAVSIADGRPPRELDQENDLDLEDHPTQPGQSAPTSPWVGVATDYFATIGLPLLEGRLLDPSDYAESAPNVVVVDRAWADRFFPGQRALGRRFHSGGCNTCPWTTVVGIVGTVKYLGVDAPDQGTVYWPLNEREGGRFILIRSDEPSALAAPLQRTMRELDPNVALSSVATIDELVTTSLTTQRYLTVLIGSFGLAALLLSLVGIYGVMTHFVQQHRRDIGIRLALGGDPSRVGYLVINQGLAMAGAGVLIGLVATFFTSKIIATLLFGVSATDSSSLAIVSILLMAAAVTACVVPARRAARVDPVHVLREGS
jgi:putative ABC transport system permease protein